MAESHFREWKLGRHTGAGEDRRLSVVTSLQRSNRGNAASSQSDPRSANPPAKQFSFYQIIRPVGISHFGSTIFGLVLIGVGLAIKKFVVDAGLMNSGDQATSGKVAIGIIVVGAFIAVANIAWAIFCVMAARR